MTKCQEDWTIYKEASSLMSQSPYEVTPWPYKHFGKGKEPTQAGMGKLTWYSSPFKTLRPV